MSASVSLCLCVCLSVCQHISGATRANFTNFCACCLCHVRFARVDMCSNRSVFLRNSVSHRCGIVIYFAAGHFKCVSAGPCGLWIGHGSVVLRQGDKIPRERGNFAGFLLNDNALQRVRWKRDRPGRGWWECTARAKSDIYDCLVVN